MNFKFRKYLLLKIGISEKIIDEIIIHFNEVKVNRNKVILKQGEICDSIFFVAKGCLQFFTVDAIANEITRDIATENTWCCELISFRNQKPAMESIRAVEPTILIEIKKNAFEKLNTEGKHLDKIYNEILEVAYANSVYRFNAFANLSPLERMKWLKEFRPKLYNRLNDKLIASYLNVDLNIYLKLKDLI